MLSVALPVAMLCFHSFELHKYEIIVSFDAFFKMTTEIFHRFIADKLANSKLAKYLSKPAKYLTDY